MVLKIAQLGQPVLRKAAELVQLAEIGSPEFEQFLDAMLETLTQAHGAGLAGPQVFARRRLFLAGVLPPRVPDGPAEIEIFLNPRLLDASAEKTWAWEGCLSFPELLVLVPRHKRVRIEYLNRRGEPCALDLEDFAARVVQHEYDHLEGILTLDRAPSTRHIIKATEIDAFLEGEED
jgi:peptide deformylase